MKKFMLLAVVAFWSSVFTLLIVSKLVPDVQAEDAASVVTANEQEGAERPAIITMEELARHDTEEDCWMAINGKVYDFTTYLPKHPSAPEVMLEWCGKEASNAYKTKGYGRPHSPRADAMMPRYLVGTLQQD